VSTFSELSLLEPLQRAITAAGYETPTPIQAQAIPLLLDGHDLIGCAQTGTGKTAAFALPVLDILARERPSRRHIRALVLSPTRELAAQIQDSFQTYGRYLPLKSTVIFGGVKPGKQIQALNAGIDVLVATPGRLLDLIGQGYIDLKHIEFFVLDEADRMLDMGFIHDIRRVIKHLPDDRQSLLFSATMPPPIAKLAQEFLYEPKRVDADPPSSTVQQIDETVMFVARADKRRLLAHLLKTMDVEQAIVFTRTKHGANRLVKQLDREGLVAAAIHGNKSQNARTRALNGFRDGSIPVLVATDIASRGIDVMSVSHVFNFDLPNEPESYVHRIGRTGRAGRAGIAIAFCDPTEGDYLRQIEKLTGAPIERVVDQPFHDAEAEVMPPSPPKQKRTRHRNDRQGQGRPGQGRSGRSGQSRSGRSGEGRPGEGRPGEGRPGEGRSEDRPAQDRQPRRDGEAQADASSDGRRRRRRRRRRGGGGGQTAQQPSTQAASTNDAGNESGAARPAGQRRRRRRRGGRGRGPKPAPAES
jgi:ATP-dependent RNA helicase RhlE